MVWFIFVLVMVVFCLVLYVWGYKKELKKLTGQLQEIADGKTSKYVDVSLIDGTLEELAVQLNRILQKQEKLFVGVKKQEEKLKSSIANISHDLRTPLTSIIGYTFLAKHYKTQNVETALEVIEKKAKFLNSLLNSFYEISLLDTDKTDISMGKVDIVKITSDCLLGNVASFEERNMKPNLKIPDHAIFIASNEVVCERIVQNLLSNAIRYSKKDVSVKLECKAEECILTIGNETDLQDVDSLLYLFDRFYTADKSRASGGTGLGLSIVKILLEKTGGWVKDTFVKDGVLFISISFPLWGTDSVMPIGNKI